MPIRDALAAFPDVVALRLRAGQVLVYPRHVPPGIFVVLKGTLRRFGGPTVAGEPIASEPIAIAPFAIPDADELAEPAQTGVVAKTDAEILFVPRSVLLRDRSIARRLAALGLTMVTLHDRSAG